jgi:predicted dehydrogenase
MTIQKVNIGILGCAGIAKRSVIPALKMLEHLFELKYIASQSTEKAEEFSAMFSCQPIAGYEEMINHPEVEAVYIPLPVGLHQEWINRALMAGKHVYAEKSMAYRYSEAQEMVTNARSRGLALMEGFMFLYHAQHQVVFNLLRAGKIGAIRHFASSFGFPPLPTGNFRYSEPLGGGVLLDAACYPLRATHFILGDDFNVQAATMYCDQTLGTGIYGSAFLSNSKGIGASIAFGFDNLYQCSYEIWGERGKISVLRAFTPPPDLHPAIIVEDKNGRNTIEAPSDNHFIHSLEEFHAVIRNESARERHYREILLQSMSLDLIRKHSTS